MAASRGCYVEITTRQGHSLTNGHVARTCQQAGAQMVLNSDAHSPGDFVTLEFAQKVARGAGLSDAEAVAATVDHPSAILNEIMKRRQYRRSI
jgi:histidinol phosphatase-like PHP family hydrolase